MMAGLRQIMSAIIFVSVKDAVRMSLAFIGGAAIGVTAGVVIAKGLASLLGINTAIGDSSDPSTLGKVIQIGLVLLLVAAAIRNFLKRATIEPPKWLGALEEADAKRAFTLGLLLLSIFPSDAIVLLPWG